MPGQPITIGPFIGGLNTRLDPSAIDDRDLADIVNFEVDLDGSLRARPAITDSPIQSNATSRHLLLGIFPLSIGPVGISSTLNDIYKYEGNAWTIIAAGRTSKVAVQYLDAVYVISDGPGSGGKYTGAWTDITTMPRGDTAVVFKNRIFIGGGVSQSGNAQSTLYYSEPTKPETYTHNIQINPGDGQYITGLVVYNDNLLIFKNNSTYVLSFDDDPVLGTLRQISPTIGASRTRCAVQNENEVYIMHEDYIYELVNYNFDQINEKVVFSYDPSTPSGQTLQEPVFLSVVGERLICRYYNNVYVYYFETRAWSRWKSSKYFGPIHKDPVQRADLGYAIYYMGSATSPNSNVYQLKDGYTTTDAEEMECSLATKIYSIEEPSRYKRLFWWGADILVKETIIAKAEPITRVFTISWDDVARYSWDDLAGNSWDSPLAQLPSVDTTVSFTGTGQRQFVKFMKSLRFRQIQFRLSLTTNCIRPTTRVFSFLLFVSGKQKVVKQVS